METDHDYRYHKAGEGLCNFKELQTNVPLLSHVHTLRNDTEQNSINHQTAPYQRTCWIQTW